MPIHRTKRSGTRESTADSVVGATGDAGLIVNPFLDSLGESVLAPTGLCSGATSGDFLDTGASFAFAAALPRYTGASAGIDTASFPSYITSNISFQSATINMSMPGFN